MTVGIMTISISSECHYVSGILLSVASSIVMLHIVVLIVICRVSHFYFYSISLCRVSLWWVSHFYYFGVFHEVECFNCNFIMLIVVIMSILATKNKILPPPRNKIFWMIFPLTVYTGKSYWRGRLSTVDLLVLVSLYQLIFIFKILLTFFYKKLP